MQMLRQKYSVVVEVFAVDSHVAEKVNSYT